MTTRQIKAAHPLRPAVAVRRNVPGRGHGGSQGFCNHARAELDEAAAARWELLGKTWSDDGMSINVRLRSDQLATLDRWIEGLSGAKRSRAEAIRRLIDLGLSHASPNRRLSHEARAHASALAAKVGRPAH